MDGVGGKVILDAVRHRMWGVTISGAFFLSGDENSEAINLYRFQDEKVIRAGRLPFLTPREFPHISFSSDGHWALTNQVERRESDLMMKEGFC